MPTHCNNTGRVNSNPRNKSTLDITATVIIIAALNRRCAFKREAFPARGEGWADKRLLARIKVGLNASHPLEPPVGPLFTLIASPMVFTMHGKLSGCL